MSNRYRYEKFEKLSDAVIAWENGETIWFRDCDHETYSPKQSTDNKFYTDSMYYRRIEVKPLEFELEMFKHRGILEMIKINGEYYSVYPLPNIHPNRGYKKTTIKMREVIE